MKSNRARTPGTKKPKQKVRKGNHGWGSLEVPPETVKSRKSRGCKK